MSLSYSFSVQARARLKQDTPSYNKHWTDQQIPWFDLVCIKSKYHMHVVPSRNDNNFIVVEVHSVAIDARCSCSCTDALVVLIPLVFILLAARVTFPRGASVMSVHSIIYWIHDIPLLFHHQICLLCWGKVTIFKCQRRECQRHQRSFFGVSQ